MKGTPKTLFIASGLTLVGCVTTRPTQTVPPELETPQQAQSMELGNFSISLSVKDVHASKSFYEKLGFSQVGGNIEQNWVILQNSTSTIGLFQGMFERNMLTFNPGWDRDQQTPVGFQDIREVQAKLKANGLTVDPEADPTGEGPASFMIMDPDGNPILVDQHVPRPNP